MSWKAVRDTVEARRRWIGRTGNVRNRLLISKVCEKEAGEGDTVRGTRTVVVLAVGV